MTLHILIAVLFKYVRDVCSYSPRKRQRRSKPTRSFLLDKAGPVISKSSFPVPFSIAAPAAATLLLLPVSLSWRSALETGTPAHCAPYRSNMTEVDNLLTLRRAQWELILTFHRIYSAQRSTCCSAVNESWFYAFLIASPAGPCNTDMWTTERHKVKLDRPSGRKSPSLPPPPPPSLILFSLCPSPPLSLLIPPSLPPFLYFVKRSSV